MSESYRVVQVTSIFDETPEGQYQMDRIRMAYEAIERDLERLLTPEARERILAGDQEFTRRVVFGTEEPCS